MHIGETFQYLSPGGSLLEARLTKPGATQVYKTDQTSFHILAANH
jgi:hypothetical protein